MEETILITGAGGFIGRDLTRALAERGRRVEPATRKTCDLLDPAAVKVLMERVRPAVVVHLAWTTAHPGFWRDPANLDWAAATLGLAREFVRQGGRRFIGIGSAAQYDWKQPSPQGFDEESAIRQPATLYGAAKNSTFELLSAFFRGTRAQFAWACLFHPYGPGEDRPTLVPSVIRQLMERQPVLCTAGTQKRDFIYIDDIAEALAALVDAAAEGPFNIGTASGTPVAEAATMIGRMMECPDLVRLGALGCSENDNRDVVARIDRIRSVTGWAPRTSLEAGLRNTIDWWRQRDCRNANV